MLKLWFIGILILCACCAVNAQQVAGTKTLFQLMRYSDSLINENGAEKLYIQFDKPYYAISDTIWLKAYLLNDPTYGLSARSRLLHIDIANDSNKVVKQLLLSLQEGLAWGNISLDDKIFKPGDYTLRAYTNWMRNFGEEIFFYKDIRVAGANESAWLINSRIGKDTGTEGIKALFQLTTIDKRPLVDSILNAELVTGKKVTSRQHLRTDRNGMVGMTFLPDALGKQEVILQNNSKSKKVIIPVILNRPEKTDVQFMPEGGSLVADLPARIGFKAIGEDGRGVTVSGVVTDRKDSVVASFHTLHNGMGSFYMQPQAGESYRAKVSLPGAVIRYYPLPAVKVSGTLLQVKNPPRSDSLDVIVAATPDYANASYYIIGKARGLTCYAAVVDLGKDPYQRSRIAKSKFPQGIAHFTVMTTDGKPLNERLIYISRPDNLRINVQQDQQVHQPKDSIALRVHVTDNSGKPVVGNFSLAVTDDGQVKTDSLNNDNILTRLLLTSDLKGYVEEPDYYFRNNDTARQALDNLLLAQGWVNYDPPAGKLPFEAETEFKVRGRIDNVFNKGLKKQEVVLLSTRPQIVMDTVTDKDGRFVFDHFPRIDTPVFLLKPNNRNFNVKIEIEETTPQVFNSPAIPIILPWYMNTDTTLMRYVKSNAQMQQLQYYPGGGRILKEVKITAKKTVKNSYNPNGAGNADVVMDEKELEQAGKKTWAQLFKEKIPGFHEEISFHGHFSRHYEIYKRYVILIVNGELLARELPRFDIIQFLSFHTAEDIKGLEAITSDKYIYNYLREFFPSQMIDPATIAFVEITTRSGDFKMEYTPGTYLYKPLAITWPKQFYKPKYTVKDTTDLTDLRATVDWEPNVSTDKNGEATLWFCAAGTPSTYSVIIEGVDGNGMLGYKRQKLLIAKPKPAVGK